MNDFKRLWYKIYQNRFSFAVILVRDLFARYKFLFHRSLCHSWLEGSHGASKPVIKLNRIDSIAKRHSCNNSNNEHMCRDPRGVRQRGKYITPFIGYGMTVSSGPVTHPIMEVKWHLLRCSTVLHTLVLQGSAGWVK